MHEALKTQGLDVSTRSKVIKESLSLGRRCSCHPTCNYFETCCLDYKTTSIVNVSLLECLLLCAIFLVIYEKFNIAMHFPAAILTLTHIQFLWYMKVDMKSSSKCLGLPSGSGTRVVDRCPLKTSKKLQKLCEG